MVRGSLTAWDDSIGIAEVEAAQILAAAEKASANIRASAEHSAQQKLSEAAKRAALEIVAEAEKRVAASEQRLRDEFEEKARELQPFMNDSSSQANQSLTDEQSVDSSYIEKKPFLPQGQAAWRSPRSKWRMSSSKKCSGWMDKLDPYIVIELNKKKFTTSVAKYDKTSLWVGVISILSLSARKKPSKRVFWTFNCGTSKNENYTDLIIAYSNLPLRKLSSQLNMEEDVDFSAKIVLKAQGAKCGSVVISGIIVPEDGPAN